MAQILPHYTLYLNAVPLSTIFSHFFESYFFNKSKLQNPLKNANKTAEIKKVNVLPIGGHPFKRCSARFSCKSMGNVIYCKKEGEPVCKKRRLSLLLACLLLICGCTPQEIPTATTTTQNGTTTTITTTVTTSAVTEAVTMSQTAATTTATTVTKAPTTVTTTTATKRVTTTTKPEQSTLRVLSIGNSYSMDAHHYLSKLAAHEGRSIRTVNLYHSGCSLKLHYDFWKKNEAAYNYEVNGVIDWDSQVRLLDILPSEDWDVITLQDASYASCTGTAVQPYLNDLLKVIRFYCPDAKIYLHQTWAYGDGYASHNSTTGGNMAAMWEKVQATYDQVSAETGLPLIPSGLAMFNAQQAYNARGKGESIQRDGSHADYAWGCYLLALVWYKTLTGETPSNTFDAFTDAFFEEVEVRDMIHKTAMDAVAAYYPKTK